MKHRFFLLLFLFSTSVFSQNKKVVFSDNFSNNKNLWTIANNSSYSLSITKGKYSLTNSDEFFPATTQKRIVIDTKNDFSIETKILPKDGYGEYGVIWGSNGINEYSFLIDNKGRFAVTRFRNDSITFLIDWSFQAAIASKGKENTLTIKKMNSTLKFYINGLYVGRSFFDEFFGNQLGFIVNQKATIEINSIEIIEKAPQYEVSMRAPQLRMDSLIFKEPSKNGLLDEKETGKISFELFNDSQVDAFDIEVLLSSETGNSYLKYDNVKTIPTLKAHQVKKISFDIRAKYSFISTQKFQVVVSEINTRTPIVQYISIKTAAPRFRYNANTDGFGTEKKLTCCVLGVLSVFGFLSFVTFLK